MDNLHRAIVFFDDNSDSQNQSAVIRGIELAIKFDLELLLIAVIYDSAIEMYSRIDKRHFQNGSDLPTHRASRAGDARRAAPEPTQIASS